MAETQQRLQHEEEEVKIGQVARFLQSLDNVLEENRSIFTVLPELYKRFVELEANTAKGAAADTGELSDNKKELKDKREQWQKQQERMEIQIIRLEKDLNDANQKILELEAKNQQNDKDLEMLKGENRSQPDKNYHRSKCKDLKAKLRTTNEDLKIKEEKIAELGKELSSRQEDYDKEMQRCRAQLAEKEKEQAKTNEELDMVKQQHDESCRGHKAKLDEFETRIAEFQKEALSKQEDYDKEAQRNKQAFNEKEKAVKIERERLRQHYVDTLRDKESKLKKSETSNKELTYQIEEYSKRNENLIIELQSKNQELRHYMDRFKQQEKQFNSDLSNKEMEVNKLKLRLKQQEEKFISDFSLKEMEITKLKRRLAGICEKRVKQDQRRVENILELNQRSEVEKDFKEFFDSDREDALDIIQSIYGSEEEIDVHVYYPRIACTIFVTAYEHAYDVKKAVIELFKEITNKTIYQAAEVVHNYRLTKTDGHFCCYPISNDDPNTSGNSTADVLDALLISLKETSHICNLEYLETEVSESAWEKWNKWHKKNTAFINSPSWEVLTRLDSYIKACIRLTWRMATQVPSLHLEYHSCDFDSRIHKKTAYRDTTENNPGIEEISSEEIECYLWPGLTDGGERIIRPGDVLCKINGEISKQE